MARFPVTVKDEVQPTPVQEEPTRDEIAKHPEGVAARVERTRRYFRLMRKATKLHYAKGLDSASGDFA